MVRALASHQCGPVSSPGVDAICGLSLSFLVSLALRGVKGAKRDGEKCPERTIFHSNLLCSSQSVFKGSRTLGEFLADHFQGLKVNRTSLQLQLE